MTNLERGFISKEKILNLIGEEDIFKLVFGKMPEELEYVTSPFRLDNNPGCWFQRDIGGSLRFVDFANFETIQGITMSNIDCFNAVQVYFELPNFYSTLKFIEERLIKGRDFIPSSKKRELTTSHLKKAKVRIVFEPRNFTKIDGRFWGKFGITKEQLIEDKVFPVLKYTIINSKAGKDVTVRPDSPTFAFTNFKSENVKLYAPYLKKGKFITTCTEDDIGELDSIPNKGDKLIISKSYKDCRILRNFQYHSIWIQNEVTFPANNLLLSICNRFDEIIVFMDNDRTGIWMAGRLCELINTFFPNKARPLHLPPEHFKSITDPGEVMERMGKKHLYNFLKDNI